MPQDKTIKERIEELKSRKHNLLIKHLKENEVNQAIYETSNELLQNEIFFLEKLLSDD